MASTTTSRGGRAPIVGINVTPMVDVVLVLLVIMMVSANFIVSQSINVDLPKASNADRMMPSVAVVTIQSDGQYGYNDVNVTEQQLIDKLKAAHGENPDLNLIVSGDTEAKHGGVVKVLDLAKGQGITRFAIAVERE